MRDVFIAGAWQFQPMTGNFAFAGIDMALWDPCAKACGQPLYRLFGGAMRETVDYFYYLKWGTPEEIAAQCPGRGERGYRVFYLKVGGRRRGRGGDARRGARRTIGERRKIRIDVNQAWSVPQAARLLKRLAREVRLDFVEAPVPIDPVVLMLDLKRRVAVLLCVNEGPGGARPMLRAIMESRCGDYLCFSQYWVGSLSALPVALPRRRAQGW